jgi:hypothetical protein
MVIYFFKYKNNKNQRVAYFYYKVSYNIFIKGFKNIFCEVAGKNITEQLLRIKKILIFLSSFANLSTR